MRQPTVKGEPNMNETFGKRFQRLRKKANLTQEDVAEKLNITPQAISRWENDISSPDISVLSELADMFCVTVDELIGKEPKTVIVPEGQRKPFDSLMLKMKILSEDGDKVNINFPLALVKAFLNSGVNIGSFNGNDALKNVDFNQIILLCEQGMLGKLMDIESSDGATVEIWVE